MDEKIQEFLIGGVLAVFAVISLFVAARAEGVGQYGALALFAILIGLIFYRISLAKHGNDVAH
jgi:crotonobetainyl-CoA:carnitine CoA-transferase CaiB-like acyl-CoA transferase